MGMRNQSKMKHDFKLQQRKTTHASPSPPGAGIKDLDFDFGKHTPTYTGYNIDQCW